MTIEESTAAYAHAMSITDPWDAIPGQDKGWYQQQAYKALQNVLEDREAWTGGDV